MSEAPHGYGQLALDAGYRLPLKVLQSAAGFYLGTFSTEEGPVSRESAQYFATQEDANDALESGDWTQRAHP